MFKHVPQVASADQRSPTTTPPTTVGDEDDSASLASTDTEQHDPNEEFDVKTIHLEMKSDKPDSHEMSYLVEWENYPLDRCTWEPASNIGPELLKIWEEKKERQKKGEEEVWTLDMWKKILEKSAADRAARHRIRNARRKRLCLPLTEPIDESEDTDDSSDDSSDDNESEAAEEDTSVGHKKAKNSHPPAIRRTSGSTTVPKARTATKSTGKSTRKSTGPTKRIVSSDRRPSILSRKSSLNSSSVSRVERPSTTGYQGTARKTSDTGSSGSTNRVGAAGVGAVGGSNADGGRRLTARKTNPVTVTGAVNVFAAGKMPVKRTNKSVSSGPNMEGTMYHNWQARRRAELKSRNKEDLPPEIPPPLVSASTSLVSAPIEAPSDRRHSMPLLASVVTQGVADKDNTAPEPASAVCETGSKPSSALTKEKPPLKRKKSVRFFEDDEAMFVEPDSPEGEPMEIDSPPEQSSSPPMVTQQPPQPLPNKNLVVRTVEKKLRFGVAPEIMASFADVASDPDDPWLAEFLKVETLSMNYTFSAHDFNEKKDFIWESLLCYGAVSSPSESIIERVAINLRDVDSGLYYLGSEYNLMVYPTGCDEWKQLTLQWGLPPSTSETEGALRYILLRPAMDCRPFLRPSLVAPPTENPVPFGQRMMQALFNFDYQDLLPIPNNTNGVSANHFFLVFPADKNPWLAAVFQWLRVCDPNCRIYTSHDAGAWSAFCNSLGETSAGTVIVHETVSLHLHRFPGLWSRLHEHKDVYWCLSEATPPRPVFPSLTLSDEVVPPGEIFFTELFPYERRHGDTSERDDQFILKRTRHVILVTPSFLSSEPYRAWELLDWFWTFLSRDPQQRIRLVTAFNLHDYMEDLAHQKSSFREKLMQRSQTHVVRAEITANLKGVSKDDCDDRSKACAVARALHYRRAKIVGPCDINEDASPLIYAPSFIDANDEQSLVNWFGWWSGMRMDQYRGFHVLGSSPTMRYNKSKRGERLVRLPRYSSVTINDPDMVRETVLESMAEASTQDMDQQVSAVKANKPWAYESNRLPSERNISAFIATLRDIDAIVMPPTLVRLYWYPISWVDSSMGWDFGDPQQHFKSYTPWWTYALQFMSAFRAYAGFFYTIAEEWDPKSKPAADQRLERHPWIAIYRPAQPKPTFVNKGFKFGMNQPVELVIWDPAAKDRYPGDQIPREEDLIYAQRQLVQLVREHTAEKNMGSWLEQVWFGGFQPPAKVVDPPYPVDITLQWLEEMMGNPFAYIPEENRAEGMMSRGFRKVKLADRRSDHPMADTSSTSGAPKEVDTPSDSDDDDDEDETSMIFHPPRGILPPNEHTRCTNRLFEAAAAARRDANLTGLGKEILFEFVPTTKWYDIHKQERRGNEHMGVGPWEEIFNRFRIKASADQGEASGSRG